MFCKNCGQFIADGANFCVKCGYSTNDLGVTANQSQPANAGTGTKSKKGIIALIIVLAVFFSVLFAVCIGYYYLVKTEKIVDLLPLPVVEKLPFTDKIETNPYNRMGYVDISGKTVQDIANTQGLTLEAFLKLYKLPEDMPGNTTEAAAYYTIPAGIIAEMNGLDFAALKDGLKLPENVTEDTPWGEAEGGITVADYIGGEDKLAEFKEKYGLGDEVTGATTWKEVRNKVDTVTKKEREEGGTDSE